jgi:hypothetical protein
MFVSPSSPCPGSLLSFCISVHSSSLPDNYFSIVCPPIYNSLLSVHELLLYLTHHSESLTKEHSFLSVIKCPGYLQVHPVFCLLAPQCRRRSTPLACMGLSFRTCSRPTLSPSPHFGLSPSTYKHSLIISSFEKGLPAPHVLLHLLPLTSKIPCKSFLHLNLLYFLTSSSLCSPWSLDFNSSKLKLLIFSPHLLSLAQTWQNLWTL